MQNKQDTYRMAGAHIYPQSQLLVLHDSRTGKLYLHLFKVREYEDYDYQLALITSLRISEFTTYFCLYDERTQEQLLSSIISTIGKASKLSLSHKRAHTNPFPKVLKRLAKKLIRFYRHNSDGGFLTHVFHEKIYGLMKRIWRDTLAYARSEVAKKKLRPKLLLAQPQEAFLFEC